MTCDNCKQDGFSRLRSIGNFLFVCPDCIPYNPKVEAPSLIDKVFIKGYGEVSKKRLDELGRRVQLPYDKPGGGYYIGRKMENGKVSENRQPDYRP